MADQNLGEYIGTIAFPNRRQRLLNTVRAGFRPMPRRGLLRPTQTVPTNTPRTSGNQMHPIDQGKVVFATPQPNPQSIQQPSQSQQGQSSSSAQNQQQDQKSDDKKKEGDLQKQIEQVQKENPDKTIVVKKKDDKNPVPLPAAEVSKELLRIKSVFPFDLFPDELIIEENRVIVNNRHFMWSNSIGSVMVEDLKFFNVNTAIIFASITFKGEDVYSIAWLKPQEAIKAKELVDGLYLKAKEKLELPSQEAVKVAEAAEKIGSADLTR